MSAEGLHKLGMPKWGLSMTEGRLNDWLVEEGVEVRQGQELCEVETDKITGAVEATADGVLRRRVAQEGEVVPVGGLLGVIGPAGVPDADVDAFVQELQASFVPGEQAEDEGPKPEVVEVGAGTLRFLKEGDGEPLVLLHGFGGDLNNWLFTTPALAGAGLAVHALDLPGHGESTKDVGAGDLDSLATAVEQFLDAQGLQRAHLAGHSLGALVAVAVALRAPGRVGSLTLVAPAGFGEEINRDYIEGFIAAESRRELKPVLQLLFADEGLVTRTLVDDVLRFKRIDGVDAALRAIAGAVFPGGRQKEDVRERLSELDVPVLVVWGREDRIIPASQAEGVAEGVEVHVLDGAGHSPHMEAAGEVNRLVERFLAGARA